MIGRLSKALLSLLMGLLLLLVGVDNVVDYDANFAFVSHVMSMDTVSAKSTLAWRAITSPVYHHAAYALIILLEILSGVLCTIGAVRLWAQREASAQRFNAAKDVATAGLVCALALYLFGFMTLAGEWFQMWQSPTWNAQSSTFRFVGTIGLVLIFLSQRDGELSEGERA